MKPYYEDEHVTLYHGDCRDTFLQLPDESIDCVITDPPFSDRAHANVRGNSKGAGRRGNSIMLGIRRDFGAITETTLREALAECGRVTKGWVVSSLDYHHAFTYDADPPDGLRLMRIGVWLKANPLPQMSGDRPAAGWEAIAYLHRADRRSQWNGGGGHGNWYGHNEHAGLHPTAKPLPMVARFVRQFTNPGDLILDPYAGSGTTLRAAKDEGRRAIGVELDERYCELAARRLTQDVLDFGAVS